MKFSIILVKALFTNLHNLFIWIAKRTYVWYVRISIVEICEVEGHTYGRECLGIRESFFSIRYRTVPYCAVDNNTHFAILFVLFFYIDLTVQYWYVRTSTTVKNIVRYMKLPFMSLSLFQLIRRVGGQSNLFVGRHFVTY